MWSADIEERDVLRRGDIVVETAGDILEKQLCHFQETTFQIENTRV
jgi:hypothetical protein